MPLADKGTELVGGEVEPVEVGKAVLALNLINPQLDLAERVVLVFLEISEGNLEDTSLKGIVGVLQTGGTVDEGLSNTVSRRPLSALIQHPCISPFLYTYSRGFTCCREVEVSLSDLES